VNYGYDSPYRLTSEAVGSDPNNHDGTTSYTYDAVGNRQQLLVNGVTANAYTYDADDRLGTDQYDGNGNTALSAGVSDAYDFENHLIQKGSVAITYDGDGNRVSETVGGVTTNYLVDAQNPTGYAQVVDELQGGAVTRTYSYGLERIDENQVLNSTWTPSFYGYDGHGSVRQLTNSTGSVTDTYDYDAFGTLVNQTGSTPNNYLFAGEQYDPALSLYYDRARYLNTATGRFWSMDSYEGDEQDPLSLHKYLYASSDPVNGIDPSGHDDLGEVSAALSIAGTISAISNISVAGAISLAYGSYPDAVAFGVFVGGEVAGVGSSTLSAIGGYEVVFAPRLREEGSFWWGGVEPSSSAPLSPSDFGHIAHGRHVEAGIFIAWYWNLNDLNPGNFGLYAIAVGSGFYAYEFTAEGATASLTGQILYNSGVPEIGAFSIGGGEASASAATSASEGALAAGVAGYEALFSAIAVASSKGAINPAGGAAATALNAGVGALWVASTYGRSRQ
jgi:RHS repeat-associated protein